MKNKIKLFAGTFSALLTIIAILAVMPVTDETPLPETLEIQTELETQIEPEVEILEAAPPVITASPPVTESPTTIPAAAEITPILVEELIVEEVSVSEEIIIIEIVETPLTIQPAPPPQETLTSPPTEMPEGAQWAEDGQYYKIEDEQKYIWDNVLGWGRDNGKGTVTIMDAQTSGYRFVIEPCGTVNLSKLIAPDGRGVQNNQRIALNIKFKLHLLF
jgi:hypothetical protein